VGEGDTVRIEYRRPPGRITVFEQACVYENSNVIVTLAQRTGIAQPMVLDGVVVLEAESPVVWFTFSTWQHDIGRFHLPDGTFTGLYANVITPVEFDTPRSWRTTDLFLDLWLAAGSSKLGLLDEDELETALARGWITESQAKLARAEAERISAEFAAGGWPPAIVHEWTLQRARERRHSD
jgi:predicted RNA-binding protein associated with RNAse of E/G family